MRSESEVRAAIERLAQETHGSYEELAGAEWALRWVLGESEWSEDAAREKKP
jgi:hypothetical protein